MNWKQILNMIDFRVVVFIILFVVVPIVRWLAKAKADADAAKRAEARRLERIRTGGRDDAEPSSLPRAVPRTQSEELAARRQAELQAAREARASAQPRVARMRGPVEREARAQELLRTDAGDIPAVPPNLPQPVAQQPGRTRPGPAGVQATRSTQAAPPPTTMVRLPGGVVIALPTNVTPPMPTAPSDAVRVQRRREKKAKQARAAQAVREEAAEAQEQRERAYREAARREADRLEEAAEAERARAKVLSRREAADVISGRALTRADWRRAIILGEVLAGPVGMRGA